MLKVNTEEIKELIWYVPLELSHSSYVYTALTEFASHENIPFKVSIKNKNIRGRCTITPDGLVFSNHYNPKISRVKVVFKDGTAKRLAFDLDDNPTYLGASALAWATVYYKRSYQSALIDTLPSEKKNKIAAFGLPFMVRPRKLQQINKILILFFCFKIRELLKLDSLIGKRLRSFHTKVIRHALGFLRTRTLDDFQLYKPFNSDKIFYQKRLFANNSTLDLQQTHTQRIEIVQLLKHNFSKEFVGGLQRNSLSESDYPELISTIEGNQQSFLEAMRLCGICVYTRGLMQSTGWTLPEFLSQGKCIVAEKIYNDLPFELIHGEQLLFFETQQELVQQCKELISNAEKRAYLGKNARAYYEKHISPNTFFKHILA